MAHLTKVTGSLKSELPYMYNVSNSVCMFTGTNTREDVLLVQLLLREAIGEQPVPERPMVTGVMDCSTAFWIYLLQEYDRLPHIDGAVTPSQSDGRHSKGMFFIAHLNRVFKKISPEKWAALPDRPDLDPVLRQQLKKAA
jgi:hypothetical protein